MQIDLNKEDLELMNPTVLARMVQLQPAMVEASDLLKEAAAEGTSPESDDENVKIEVFLLTCYANLLSFTDLVLRDGFIAVNQVNKARIPQSLCCVSVQREILG